MKRITLFGSAVLLAAACFCVFSFQGNTQTIPRPSVPPGVGLIIADDTWFQSHKDRTTKLLDQLKKESLDETFIGLLDDQQYHFPGYLHGAAYMPEDLEKIFSTRRFLKVFQQFAELPQEQAVLKLNEFCKQAIKEFDTIKMEHLKRKIDPSPQSELPLLPVMGDEYMVCVTMLLAARMGEHELLLNQIDKMELIVESHVNAFNTFPASGRYAATISSNSSLLDDDCIVSILIYALDRAKIDWKLVLLQDALMLNKKTIPLCRWDAEAAHYDFLVKQGHMNVDPRDILEQFDVYEILSPLKHDVAKKKALINTLKRCLSK